MTDPAERDRTLARVRTTTAVTGVGALLAGWLGHAATAGAADPATGTVEQDGGTADDGLTGPDAIPAPGGAGTGQPGVVSGGS